MIHIVHFQSSPGGIEILIQDIIKAFPAGTFNAFIIRPPKQSNHNIYSGTEIKTTYGHRSNLIALWRLFFYARKYKKEIFHVYNSGPFYLLALRLAGVTNLVYSIHGTIYWRSGFERLLRKAIWRLALSDKYRITTNSEFSRKVFISSVSDKEKNIEVVYNPIDSSKYQFSGEQKRNGPDFKVIYAGRLAKGKNLFRWLDVAQVLRKKSPLMQFILYGEGPLKADLIKYAEEKGLADNVKFSGFTVALDEAFREADLFIFISEYESFGNVVVESILCGTPVIASDIPSMREIFKNYPQVLVPLDENLLQNIADKVEHLDDISVQMDSMIREFRSRFSAEKHYEKLQSIYDSFHS